MRFTKRELKDIIFAWLIISIAFTLLFSGGLEAFFSPLILLVSFLISLFTAGIGFLFHELMHKYIAQRYGLRAEFHAFYKMLWLALIFSLFGFIIAAPGAVFIEGRTSRERYGKIGFAWPMMNVVLALIFFFLVMFVKVDGVLSLFFSYGLRINALLGLFNLIPFSPFDGKSVYEWSKAVYFIGLVLALGLYVVGFGI